MSIQFSSPEPDAERVWTRRAFALIACVTLLRVLFLMLAPVDLVADEAYYWDWGRYPDIGYYSKPPLVGWLMALWGPVAGASDALIRLPAALMAGVVLTSVFMLGRALAGARTGFAVVLLAACSLGNNAMGLLFTIDAPFVAAWSVALLCFVRATVGRGEHQAKWFLGYAVAGIAGVLTKQMMLLFPVLAVLYLALDQSDRALLRRPAVWLWLFSPLLGLVPTLWWNVAHNWATVRHTAHHFDKPEWSLLRALGWFGTYLGGQLLLVGPAVVAGVAIGMSSGLRDKIGRFALIFSAIPLLVIAAMSLTQPVLLNWPAAYWVAGFAVAGAIWTTRTVDGRLIPASLWKPQAWLIAVVMVALLISGRLSVLGPYDLTRRARGWRELAAAVDATLPATADRSAAIIVSGHRQYASLLGFYMKGQPRLLKWKSPGDMDSQYDFWRPSGPVDRAVIICATSSLEPAPDLKAAFDRVERVGEAWTPAGPKKGRRVGVWVGYGMRRWWDEPTEHARVGTSK